MTTSYELSLKLKELGVEQKGGEYYFSYRGVEIYHHESQNCVFKDMSCRALTLGELVRMLPEISIIKLSGDKYGATCVILSIDKGTQISTSPEEAAGELLCELKQKEG